ncbi:MAG: hypothetical protein R2848_11220 [Thermomicrobiales bacterium]
MPFRDAIYRGDNYLNDEQLFGKPRGTDLDLPERVVAAIAAEGFRPVGSRAYAPLASGFHVDHQLGFQAGVLLASYGWDVWFYEDLPYSLLEGRGIGPSLSRESGSRWRGWWMCRVSGPRRSTPSWPIHHS